MDKSELSCLKLVMNQFVKANGLKEIDLTSRTFIEDFGYYLKDRNEMGKVYLNLLSELCNEENINSENTYEVGKCSLDTITSNTNISIISNNVLGFDNDNILNGKLVVYRTAPYVLANGNLINLGDNKRFITQNPYSYDSVLGWEHLHNYRTAYISIGMFGSVYDKDFSKKMMQLNNIKNTLNADNLYMEYTTDNDAYYAIVSSKSNGLRLVKKKSL